MKLEGVDFLHAARTAIVINGAIQQLQLRSFEPIEARGVGTKGEIKSNGTNGRAVTEADSGGLNHVIKILQIVLAIAQAEIVERAINVARILEQNAAEVVAQ